jgi:putative ABC transport system permease protein
MSSAPGWMTEIRTRLAPARLDPAREFDIAQELASHLDDRYAELLRDGTPPDEARRLALDELREHARMREQLVAVERQEAPLPPLGAPAGLLHGMRNDVTYALRRLRATPAFTTFSIVTLALGIGATTAVYSAVYTAVLRPPPLRDIDRVANLYHRDPRRGGSLSTMALSPPDVEDYAAAQTSFTALAPWSRFRHALVANGGSEVIAGEMVGGDYFRVVGIDAALGRTLQPADDRPGAPRVIVLEDGLWRRRFGGDPAVIGRTVNLGGDIFEIVGVMPREFRGVDVPNVMPTGAWVALSATRSPNNDDMTNRERRWLLLKGRLAPGVLMEHAFAEFHAIGKQLDLEHPIGRAEPGDVSRHQKERNWFLMPAADVRMHESMDRLVGPLVVTIMIAVGLVLLVACTNIANLMLARGTGRQHEQAVRLALGASRWRLVRAQLVEATLVTAAGGLAAYVVARIVMVRLLTSTFQMTPGFVIRFEPEFHASVGLVAAGSTLLALLVFGLIPALHTTRTSLRQSMASDSAGAAVPRWRGRRNLLALQVTVSAGLVTVAFLCAQQVVADSRRDSGMDLDRIALARVDFKLLKRDEAHGRRVLEEALHRARLQPGVVAAAVSSGLPAGVGTPGAYIDGTRSRAIELVAATPEIFEVLGVALTAGRGFDARDAAEAAPVAVVSGSVARLVAGTSDPIGRAITLERRRWAGEEPREPRTVTIVGVAADTDTGSLGSRTGGVVYVPFTQHYEPGMSLVVRTGSDPAGLPDRLRRIVQGIDPDTAVLEAVTGAQLAAADSGVLKVGALGTGLLGGLALLLAMAGLYGVMADLVARRTREMGIRMALGAGRARLVRMVLLDGIRPVAEGLALGLGIGVLLRLTFRPMFVNVLPAFDPFILLLVPAAFLACAFLAAYLPARRAAGVDPAIALRAE